MRKRLIEKFTKAKEGSLGYTLTELLVVIGIIALVCAIAIPSVIAISKALRFKQANDYAKSIFMAAQQNLTEMRSDGGLGAVQDAGGFAVAGNFPSTSTQYLATSTGAAAFELILPAGSIDAVVREAQIIIEYNPMTGNVFAVFYCDDDSNLYADYTAGTLPRDDVDARKARMLGYYDGTALDGSKLEMEQTRASVEFVNGEEGIVRVLVPVPDVFYASTTEFAKGLEIGLTITGDQSMMVSGAASVGIDLQIKDSSVGLSTSGLMKCYVKDGNTIVVEYPIDSLADKRSFANYASNTAGTAALTTLMSESEFKVLPGENITIQANVRYKGADDTLVEIEPGILSGVNPMFEYLQPSGQGGYVLAVSNGRNLQNLNALAPSIAKQVDNVVFTKDINWGTTVSYYNGAYSSGTYSNSKEENPARGLPYFVPIHNGELFGTAQFLLPHDSGSDGFWGWLENVVSNVLGNLLGPYLNINTNVPTLTDDLDVYALAAEGTTDFNYVAKTYATIEGNGHKVSNLNIDALQYQIPNKGEGAGKEGRFYAAGDAQVVEYHFTGLFGYINTPINNLHVVNPTVRGMSFAGSDVTRYVPEYSDAPVKNEENNYEFVVKGWQTHSGYGNPATGALIGAAGYNTLVTKCSVYLDVDDPSYSATTQKAYSSDATIAQEWYGVSGEGAVGGLVGYAKSHRTTNGALTGDTTVLAFSNSFAAVPVSGNMREYNGSGSWWDALIGLTVTNKDYGYSNGVGGLVGNSQMTNFYNCYASGDVIAKKCNSVTGTISINWHVDTFGTSRLRLTENGRKGWGAGGFVGTSHGTRYTNCFATGDVSGTAQTSSNNNPSGGFVGMMNIDGTHSYGNHEDNSSEVVIAQTTVFTNCYAVGHCTNEESFSGANGATVFKNNTLRILNKGNVWAGTVNYIVGDYFRLYAPHYAEQNKEAPDYKDIYVYRDSYFLNGFYEAGEDAQENSIGCASPITYQNLTNLHGRHAAGNAWIGEQIDEIKSISLGYNSTYGTKYFDKYPELNGIYEALYAAGFKNVWENATEATTHAYNPLKEGGTYPFPIIKGLDYYGDWPSVPATMGLAYYETYTGDTSATKHYFFDEEHTDDTRLHLLNGEDVLVKTDGYAIFSGNKDSSIKVTIGSNEYTLSRNSTEKVTIYGNEYYSYPLPEDAIQKAIEIFEATPTEYYVQVTAKGIDSSNTYTMYFNPLTAISHVNPDGDDTSATKPNAPRKTQYIRSARHFYGLSELENFWGSGYTYTQQLHIDVDDYTTGAGVAKTVVPVGSSSKVFNAVYRGGYSSGGVTKSYKLSNFIPSGIGFFGYVGEYGKIENLRIEITKDGELTMGSANDAYAAVLAGKNEGTINNVDLEIKNTVTVNAKTNAGALAGYSSGNITDSSVEVKDGSLTVAVTEDNSEAGGYVGKITGTESKRVRLENGKLKVSGNLEINSGANAGGFAGSVSHVTAESLSVSGYDFATNAKSNAGGMFGLASNVTGKELTVSLTGNGITAGEADNGGGLMGSITNGDLSNCEVTLKGSLSAKGNAAGAVGSAENSKLAAVDVNVQSVSGNVAAGYIGSAVNTGASNGTITIASGSSITGTDMAAGVAGSISNDSGKELKFETVPVNMSNATICADKAAGYAVTISDMILENNCTVTLGGKTTNGTVIQGTTEAAGYACSLEGTVGTSHVVGKGNITAPSAAGFVGSMSGQVTGSHVSPAAQNSDYKGNTNNNLTVSGSTEAAGFILTTAEDSVINNCYGLGKIEGGRVSGFVGTNNGQITGCMTNVTINGGNAFVATNNGSVVKSYGWYGNGSQEDTVKTVAELANCKSAYFVDLDIPDLAGVEIEGEDGTAIKMESVVLYDAAGSLVADVTSPSALSSKGMEYLIGSGSNSYVWYKNRNEYPYTLEDTEEYSYPMLRDHYGDWVVKPKFAYGLAYYEVYADGTQKTHIEDMSDPLKTVEDDDTNLSVQANFDGSGEITETGYALFCRTDEAGSFLSNDIKYDKTPMTQLTNDLLDTQYKNAYSFYKITSKGMYEVDGEGQGKSAMDTRFADAIILVADSEDNLGDALIAKFEPYQVRTAEQLGYIGDVAANFRQTHDITVTTAAEKDEMVTAAAIAEGKNYNGNSQNLTFVNPAKSWITDVKGSVTGLNLTVNGNVTAPVFGTISSGGSVALKKLEITGGLSAAASEGAVSAVVNTVGGSFSCPTVSISGDVGAGNAVFGAVSGSVNGGNADTAMSLTVGGSVNGSLVDTVSGGNVKLGDFTTNDKALPGYVLKSISGGSFTIGDVSVGDVTWMFGDMSGGSIRTGNIAANAVTKLFGAVTGVVTENISVDAVAEQLFGNVSGNGVSTGTIDTDTISKQLFGDVAGTVDTKKITVSGDAADLFGTVSAGLTIDGGIDVSGDLSGCVIETATSGADIDTGAIKLGSISGKILGSADGGNTAFGKITIGSSGEGTAETPATAGDEEIRTVTLTDEEPVDPASDVPKSSEGNSGESSTPPSTEATVSGIGTLFGPISGSNTSVSGGTVELYGEDITGNLFDSVTGGATVSGFKVKAGDLDDSLVGGTLKGTLSEVSITADKADVKVGGVLVGAMDSGDNIKSVIEDCTVNVDSVSSDASVFGVITSKVNGTVKGSTVTVGTLTAGGTVGGVAGENAGTMKNNTVNITTFNAIGSEVGGMVGKNSGTISNNGTSSVTIEYTSGESGVAIGGLVGENTGSMSGGAVSGSINLNGSTNSDMKVGGAVGNDAVDNTSHKTSGEEISVEYSGITAAVQIDADWAYGNDNTAVSPAGTGAVGAFVGYVSNGTFADCESTVDNGNYEFLGEIAYVEKTLEAKDGYSWFAYANDDGDAEKVEGTVDGEFTGELGEASYAGYTRLDDPYTYYGYKASLTNCKFVSGGTTYLQELKPVEYFYKGVETLTEEKWTTERVNAKSVYTKEEDVDFWYDFPRNAGTNNYDTDYYYYDEEAGQYYEVTLSAKKYDRSKEYNYSETYQVTLKANDEIIWDSGRGYSRFVNFDDVPTMYSKSTKFPYGSAGDDHYFMIVTEDGSNAMMNSAKSVAFKSTFTESDTGLCNAVWISKGTNSSWQSYASDRIWLYPYSGWRDSGAVTNSAKNLTIKQKNTDNKGNSYFQIESDDAFLTTNNNGFTGGDKSTGFIIYECFHTDPEWNGSFTYSKCSQLIGKSAVNSGSGSQTDAGTESGGTDGQTT